VKRDQAFEQATAEEGMSGKVDHREFDQLIEGLVEVIESRFGGALRS